MREETNRIIPPTRRAISRLNRSLINPKMKKLPKPPATFIMSESTLPMVALILEGMFSCR